MKQELAWLMLRVMYAWMFLFPLKDILRDFDAATEVVRLIMPFQTRFFTVIMILVMVLGGFSILLGAYGQIAGVFLLIYCLLGVAVHYRLSDEISALKLSAEASRGDRERFGDAVALGILGNQTSGQKNIVLAAVAFFFMLMGTGPMSLTANIF